MRLFICNMKDRLESKKVLLLHKLIFIGFVLLFPAIAKSQYKITVTDSNMSVSGNTYLLNVPLKTRVNRLYIDDKKRSIPFIAFENYEGYADTIILTDKSKEYILYQKYYRNVGLVHYIDTLKRIDEKLRYYTEIINPLNLIQGKKLICVYYDTYANPVLNSNGSEMGAAVNCFSNFNISFQKENNVQIINTYSMTIGYEGETRFYLTLTGLSLNQKATFLNGTRSCCIPNLETKKIMLTPIVYIPILISSEGLRKIH